VAGKAGREGGWLCGFYGGRRREGQVELRWLEREGEKRFALRAYINNKEMDPAATTLINGSFFWPIINGQATVASSFSLYR
jgi:hypothetical protein